MPSIPPPSDPLWNKLVCGTITHKFALFAANMAVARAVRLVTLDAAQKPLMIQELHDFCLKYAGQLGPELQALR